MLTDSNIAKVNYNRVYWIAMTGSDIGPKLESLGVWGLPATEQLYFQLPPYIHGTEPTSFPCHAVLPICILC